MVLSIEKPYFQCFHSLPLNNNRGRKRSSVSAGGDVTFPDELNSERIPRNLLRGASMEKKLYFRGR